MVSDGFNLKNIEAFGSEFVKTLADLTFLIVGAGGLGSFVAAELVRLGARKLIIADNDRVAASNLNRQILYTHKDLGKSKVSVAAKRLGEIFPDVRIEAFNAKMDKNSAPYAVSRADIVLDCSDNFATKRLLNRVCHNQKKPLITAGVGTWEGWIATFPFHEETSPCLECLFPDDLEALKELGSENLPSPVTTVAAVATLQVNEVVKLLLGEEGLRGKTLLVDLKNYQCVPIKINRNPSCSVCSSETQKVGNGS